MKDLFSEGSKQYLAFRPTYPAELYEIIYSHLHGFDTAWDCGTGNGQVALDLSKKFKKVYATDISAAQLENAVQAENIFYSLAEEEGNLEDKSVDLITVAQAIHWFDRQKFYKEVKRVAKKDAVLAVWGYGLLSINPELDKKLNDFYVNVVGPYWDPERKLIDDHYRSIDFPAEEIHVPELSFSFEWTIDDLKGYLNTWSSVKKYIATNKVNPVDRCIDEISTLWHQDLQKITFPLFLKLTLCL